MLDKNNLKYILILALGFFWCSSVYLTQEQYLVSYASTNFINIVELLFGSLSMAFGILIFAFLYKKKSNIKVLYYIFTILSIISMILFFVTKNKNIMGLLMNMVCILGTAGFGAGYHFSLLSKNVSKAYRGRVFAIGYGLGSVGTYLMIMLPEIMYSSYYSLFIYIPVILLNLLLVYKTDNILNLNKENDNVSNKRYILNLSIVVIVMSLLSALSSDIISVYTINIPGGYGASRIYYCLGLLIAGFLADKKTNIFDNAVIVSFIFSLLAIILLQNNYSIGLVAALSYFFIGFFVLFRTISFVNLIELDRKYIYLSAFGLMYSRIIEGLLVLFEDYLISNYILLIIVIIIVLSLLVFLYYLLYINRKEIKETDLVKKIAVKYGLSNQETKVLNLLVQGKSNQEIADELFISVYTVKRHVSNIYQKTKMNKKELIKKCHQRA